MKVNRAVLAIATVMTSTITLLLVITALVTAQSATPQETPKSSVADLKSIQAISVTFPPGDWPWYAQEEIRLHPEPPIAHHPTEICAHVINHDPSHPHTITLEFGVANFGIGVPFHPVGHVNLVVPPDSPAQGCVVWIPPEPGHWCLQAVIHQDQGEPLVSQRNIDIWEHLVPGQQDVLPFAVGPFTETTTISFTAMHIRPNWEVMVEPISLTLDANEPGQATLNVIPPAGEPLGSRKVVADVEGYVNGEPVGGFRKLDWPPVLLHRLKDPFFAESEISVWPHPPRLHEPTEICVELFNLSDEPQTVETLFEWANFGIGLPFDPIHEPIHLEIPPHSSENVCIWWVPPESGHFCIQVQLYILGPVDYMPQFSQLNIDVAEPLEPGVPHSIQFPVGNFANQFTNPDPTVSTIWLSPTIHLPHWRVELSPTVLPDMAPEEVRWVNMTVTPPDEPLPPDRTPIVDIRAYVDQMGEPHVIGGFRKIFRPPVILHPFPDPVYAEREISIHPYPPLAGEPAEVCVELYNPMPVSQTVTVFFSWAHFGIGIPFTPINGPRIVHLPPHSVVNECIHWVPPVSGHVCLQVELEIAGYEPQRSQRNIDVDEPLHPGEPHTLHFPVGNPFEHTVDIELGLIPHRPDWEFALSAMLLPDMGVGEQRIISLTVTPPPGVPLPEDDTPIVDVEAFAEGELIGGFRKIHRPPVMLHPFPDPPYAEREISIEPYPPRIGEPTHICVELRNPTPYPQDVEIHFAWANFGIGIPFTPINGPRMAHLPPHSIINECIHWVPPIGGHFCLQVELFMDGYAPQRSQRNIDVDEPLEPLMPDSRSFPVGNPFTHPVTVTLGLIPHLPDWRIELSDDVLPNMAPGEIRPITLTVTPPADFPPDGHPVVDVEAFAKGELIGGFRKIFRPDVPIHRPRDPRYAESEIFVHPYPPRAHEPTELSVEIRNPTHEPQTITVTFSYANFGIGLPFTPIDPPLVVYVPPEGLIRPVTMWIPPHGGLWCIQVQVKLPGHDEVFFSRSNLDVGEPLQPNVPHSRPFPVGNPFPHPVTITLGLIPHLPDWELELSQDVLPNMQPDEVREVILTVTPPDDLPPDGHPIVDVEAFVQGELLGGFRKIFRPDVPIHRPRDPVYAESEIGVDPYPVIPGQPVELSVEVFNPTDQDRVVTATFSVANFGIGLPFSPAHITPNPVHIFVPAHGAARGHVIWNPPHWRGKFCVRVTLESEGHELVWSQRNIDVGEPLQPGRPHSLVFPVGGWPYTQPVTITLGSINHRDRWNVSLSQDTLTSVQPGEPVSVTLTVTPPDDARLGTGEPIVDIEAFVDGELIGGFRKLDIPPIPLHKPHEKGYAESEISVDPDPPRQGQTAQVSTVVQNTSDTEVTVELMFGWAKFGMGIPFSTTGMLPYTRSLTLSPEMTSTAWVSWTPTLSGVYCIRVLLSDPAGVYEPQESQRNVEVVERPPCGQTRVFSFTVYNDSPFTATVDLGLITFDVPEDWEVSTVPSDTLELGPFSEGVVTVLVRIPCPLDMQALQTEQRIYALQQQAGSVPTIDVEGYIDGALVGGIEIRLVASQSPQYAIYLPVVLKRQ